MKMTIKQYNLTEKFRHMKGYLRINNQSRKEYFYDKYIVELSNDNQMHE